MGALSETVEKFEKCNLSQERAPTGCSFGNFPKERPWALFQGGALSEIPGIHLVKYLSDNYVLHGTLSKAVSYLD